MLEDGGDRLFCGLELNPVTLVSQRYLERIVTQYSGIGATMKELGMIYAFLLTLPLPDLRRIARSLDALDEAYDAWIVTLPSPIPLEEMDRLNAIADRDEAQINALRVEVISKPGQGNPDPDEPKN